MADELDSTIRENAKGPAEARADSGSVRQRRGGRQARPRRRWACELLVKGIVAKARQLLKQAGFKKR
ncbi:MAG: hypothetical protein ACYTF6_11010 [Planctomycetota bacterium]